MVYDILSGSYQRHMQHQQYTVFGIFVHFRALRDDQTGSSQEEMGSSSTSYDIRPGKKLTITLTQNAKGAPLLQLGLEAFQRMMRQETLNETANVAGSFKTSAAMQLLLAGLGFHQHM